MGRSMASLPLEPVYARVLLASFELGCPREIIDLLALLGARDSLLINNAANRDVANAARSKFVHRSGDHWMLLNILRAYEDVEGPEKHAWCRDHYINSRAMGQVLETRKQLEERCKRLGMDSSPSTGDDPEPVLSALMAGLFANTAVLQPDGSYRHALSRQVSRWFGRFGEEPLLMCFDARSFRSTLVRSCTTRRLRRSCTTSWWVPSSFPSLERKLIVVSQVMTSKTYARGVSTIPLSWLRSKVRSLFSLSLLERRLSWRAGSYDVQRKDGFFVDCELRTARTKSSLPGSLHCSIATPPLLLVCVYCLSRSRRPGLLSSTRSSKERHLSHSWWSCSGP